uniref:Uncharacterized protein n=1 Tax=Romanomermis culicivorax TaxID=13658 RepID=A0A915JJ77_ROMCU
MQKWDAEMINFCGDATNVLKDFQQPEKWLVTIESPEEIREAQRKDVHCEVEYNIKRMMRITEFQCWFEMVYARPMNVFH